MKKDSLGCPSSLFFSEISCQNTTMQGIVGLEYTLPIAPFGMGTALVGGGRLCSSFGGLFEEEAEFVELSEKTDVGFVALDDTDDAEAREPVSRPGA